MLPSYLTLPTLKYDVIIEPDVLEIGEALAGSI